MLIPNLPAELNNFNPRAFVESPATHQQLFRHMVEIEIAHAVVWSALEQGYRVSVHDLEDWASVEADVVKRSSSTIDILSAMFKGDEDRITIYHSNRLVIGSVYFVYGNDGWDVINDFTWKNTSHDIMHKLIEEGPVQTLVKFYGGE